MRFNYLKICLSFFLAVLLTACASQKTSVITGGEYDKAKNQTNYFALPYGSVVLPGKWVKTHYNSVSRQQFFKNEDSISVAIAFHAINNFEFNVDGSKTGFDFVKSYYEWDSNYFIKTNGLNASLIEQDSINNYITWRLHGTVNGGTFDSYFLFAEKNKSATSFSIMITDKWTEEFKIEFLKKLFLPKKELPN